MQDRPGRWKLIWRRQRQLLRPAFAGVVLLAGLITISLIVQSFGEGASAFEEIKQSSYDLLLTDIVMPEMDGIELARRAAELDPSLKIMFITGFAAVALHPDSRAPKEAKVLSKPFHLRELVAEVDRMMAA